MTGRLGEDEFWARLERRICAEFQGFADERLRRNWCDGLVAEEFEPVPRPCVRGRAWCGPDGQEPWAFTLLLAPGTRSRAAVDWAALLPGERLTGWLSPDPLRRTMTIDPLDGYPDR
ncbi:hypothetical protein ACFO1B_01880 [Dactylosporangium siamense]|uniref:Uncharacterized protein n=1 Tax=Dactylosporangium siamense TaxID=685454 RepID=A0A919UEA1_9ACTN|nr:hypothetical protein [Dactylosporangium siamense]GIG48415.1 hypothetical protein Dsi01nite_064560 [Dactylosporangium siamense]